MDSHVILEVLSACNWKVLHGLFAKAEILHTLSAA